jgi:hypothetical protein
MAIDLVGRVSNLTPGDSILYLSSLNNQGYLQFYSTDRVEADLTMAKLEEYLVSMFRENEDVLNLGPYPQVSEVACSVLLC